MLSETSKVDFVITGGDNVDNAQTNEVDWFSMILDGNKRVECDSGTDDDPILGAINDPKDPFFAEGLKMPWYWVTGNHDILNQGNFDVTEMTPDYVGTYGGGGTRDWTVNDGPIISGDGVVADERRAPLDGKALLERVMGHGDGHGITQAVAGVGRSHYMFDVPGTNLRIIVLDTSSPTGSSKALLHGEELTNTVKPLLDAAAGKIVIITSHHASDYLSDGSGLGGTAQPDTVTPEAFRNLVGSYPNVLMHLAGHTHLHHAAVITPTMGNKYWELRTGALAEFPHQMRMIEIWDNDNGTFGIRAVALDYSVENDPIAAAGRKRGILDFTSGWQQDGSGTVTNRNVELIVPKPPLP